MRGLDTLLPVIQIGLVVLTGVTFISLFSAYWWFADLLTHFTLQYVALAALALLALLLLKYARTIRVRNHWLVISLVLLVLHGHPVASFMQFNPAPSTTDITVMSANILATNTKYDMISGYILEEKPDIVLLLEVQQHHLDGLKRLLEEYPYQQLEPREDAFGLALLSKYSLKDTKVVHSGTRNIPYVTSTIQKPGTEPIVFYGLHPIPPVTKTYAQENYTQTKHAFLSIGPESRVIVAGDFNNTPWSSSYKSLMSQTNLRILRNADLFGTWMPQLLGGLKIDHIFVQNIYANNFYIGPNIGADHRPVIAELRYNE